MALDAKVITYWHDHGIDHPILISIAAAEDRWILLKNETKPRLREADLVTVSHWIGHRCRALGKVDPIEIAAHAGHNALLQYIHTHCHMLTWGLGDSRRY